MREAHKHPTTLLISVVILAILVGAAYLLTTGALGGSKNPEPSQGSPERGTPSGNSYQPLDAKSALDALNGQALVGPDGKTLGSATPTKARPTTPTASGPGGTSTVPPTKESSPSSVAAQLDKMDSQSNIKSPIK